MDLTKDKRAVFHNERTIRFLLLLAAVALSIKYIFVDFGIDAEFQTVMSYRFSEGALLFKEMWEPYQMSAFLCAFFIKIYTALFHTTTGIVIYLQIIGVLLDGAVACLLYRIVNKYLDCRNAAFAMAWVFFLVSPKDVPLPEYANMQIWFSMLLCITMFLSYKTQKKRWIILSALCLCGAVLSYPSCLLLFVGAILLLLYRGDNKGALLFGATCLVTGLLYLFPVFRQVSFSDFAVFLENMFSLETSHSEGLLEKCFSYLKDAACIAVVFCIAYGIAYGIVRFLHNRNGETHEKEYGKALTDALFFGIVLLISLYTVVFWKEYVRYCYSLVFLAVILIGAHYRKKLSSDKFCFYLCGTVISLFQFVATLLLTNLVLMASIPYLLIAVLMAFLPISEELKTINITAPKRNPAIAVLICGVLFLLFRNAYIIRPMNGDVSTILNIGGIVKSGPAMGIISEYMGPYMQNESMKEWEQYIKDGDSVFLIGGSLDTLGYLYSDTVIAAPSLVPTPGYNESILKYWEMNPEKYPDVIVASCWYGTLHSDLSEDSWIMQWIEEEYQPASYVDGKYWRYYFLSDPATANP